MNLSSISAALTTLDLRSCLISRDNRLVLEHYRTPNTATELAKINSCTKSVLSALICIAMDKGLLPQPDAPLTLFYPQLSLDPDHRKTEIKLEHLLTMSAGFNWTEFGGQNSFPRMTRSPDWVRFVLEQPMSDTPGARMVYNSGVSQLLSAILRQAAGMSTAKFAEHYLFGPLGIKAYEWEVDPQGVHTGGFGLKLRPSDLLKLGQLYLQEGMWENTKLISPERVNRSTETALHVEAPYRGGYGWHWWTDVYTPAAQESSAASQAYFYARGYGGQFVYIMPELSTVVVLTEDQRRKKKPPVDVFREIIAPALLAP
ncbi:serine hydrolase domain-containing protein [Paenibacillus sp. FSL M7-1046]|uniref:serine hydrolase domain-containing protein n=1 Tax=Paenibacillus sp. FSL M7-1046 TaxID=2975315 RepID=UPI0030FB60AE